jgi:Domain of unknown function (DUF4440)
MKNLKTSFLSLLFATTAFSSCLAQQTSAIDYLKNYKPDDLKLYDTILKKDSLFFAYYNTCETNLDKHADFYAENIEFLHDQGGVMTSKKGIIDATKKNICGKVTRELVKGSVEVYPIKDFGAVEIGLHKFHNNQEPQNTPSKVGRFMIVWKKEGIDWKITKVVSLH